MIDLSVLSRRRMNGWVKVRSRCAASSSPCFSIGSAYRFLNDGAVPSIPGLTNSEIDHRSASRFSTGVPVTAIRVPAGSDRIAVACLVAAFLMACASSTTTRRQRIRRRSTASRAASAYVVTIRSLSSTAAVNSLPRARSAP